MTAMNALKSQLDSLKVTAAGDTERTSPVSPSLQHQLEQERAALTNSSEEVTLLFLIICDLTKLVLVVGHDFVPEHFEVKYHKNSNFNFKLTSICCLAAHSCGT